MEEEPPKQPKIESTETVKKGPLAGFIIKKYEAQTPDNGRKLQRVKKGYVGMRKVPEHYSPPELPPDPRDNPKK